MTITGEFLAEHADKIMEYYNQKGGKIPINSEHYLYLLAQELKVSESDTNFGNFAQCPLPC